MENEISLIDSILYNLIGVKQLYEFEVNHLHTFANLTRRFVQEKNEEVGDKCTVFKDKAAKEEQWVKEKIHNLESEISRLNKEIEERKASKKKLMELFESLKKIDEYEHKESKPDELPIMEIREELDDEDHVISGDVKPYAEMSNGNRHVESARSAEPEINDSKNESVTHKDLASQQKEADHVTTTESAKVEPQKKAALTQAQKIEELSEEEQKKIDEDREQLAELLEDMDIAPKTDSKVKSEGEETKEIKGSEGSHESFEATSDYAPGKPAIDPEDILTLEMIAEDFDDENFDEDESELSRAFGEEREEEEVEEEEEEDDDDYDDESYVKVVPGGARSMFLQQIAELRQKKQEKDISQNPSEPKKAEAKKKSVTFAESVQVKEVENVSEELKKTENKRLSRFKLQRQQRGVSHETFPDEDSEEVMHDVIERDIEEQSDNDSSKISAVPASLDYRAMQDDLDTMARAYTLGMYDDDIETHGEVIEKLDDFESHNKIVESKPVELPEEPEGESEEEEDDDTVLVDKIVENEIDDADEDPDIELADEVLEANVAMDYTRLRTKMIHQYNGGFQESEKEKEYEPIEPVKTSRFKAARLGRIN
ncbi:hypothetical protein KL918_001521 [Ogataea parapolymorpha]|uniref:DUF3835 domain-containing protein n=1 Tax=Ogataea parapolymorpha (strain ATCC 26012 / BCRC 20466 / JCM 22074 / NRRL Y-7560 / DL-1) TaxID=871575 RepID=W1QEY1_OGAPD|nr:hypothetical protein HPODL_03432 [Ogataea parapolymorpha DL-1]ESW99546.1 hypothetical protein HPODL_03432 [Ogataea parapolymorpha DL-1]KAG7868878.1 hypothetical protein KL918_001521 [Ogataea parapolymorpha]KAG7873959.1 hypothetical protein KL916_001733 [Ogataea parapolymorpha]